MKVIVAGSRSFDDYGLMFEKLHKILKNVSEPVIVSGGARGADKLGERFADDMNLECIVMNADWDKHGKSAGIIRNKEMAKIADGCVCFWDGKSRGTKNMIDEAKRNDLKLRVIRFE